MEKFQDDINYVCNLELPWDKLAGKTVLITGATGTIGCFLIHVLMTRTDCTKIIAVGRSREKALERFSDYINTEQFVFLAHDINQPLDDVGDIDYAIHAASMTHPIDFATKPIETITTNIVGAWNVLKYACEHHAKRVLFLSSVEVYGENRGDTERLAEDYCGYIDCNTLRAGYTESKRAGEALCQAYKKQFGIEVVVARLPRIYGPTMPQSDSKAIAQFIKKGLAKENLVLKSSGNQYYTYAYVADAVSGLLTVLLKGESGEAYNVASDASNITLKDLAKIIADYTDQAVVFEIPDEIEAAGYSNITKAILDGQKLKRLGWEAHWDIEAGVKRTLELLS